MSNKVVAFDGNRTPITFDRGPKMSVYLHHNSPVECLLNGMQMHRLHVRRRLSSVHSRRFESETDLGIRLQNRETLRNPSDHNFRSVDR